MCTHAKLASLAAVGLLNLCNPSSHAQILAVESTYEPGQSYYLGFPPNDTYGWRFDVGSTPLSVTHLGFFDTEYNGLNGSYQVGIWDMSGNLMVQGTVQSGTASSLVGAYRFELVTPTTLDANTRYVIGAFSAEGNDFAIMGGPAQTYASEITYVGSNYSLADELAAPLNSYSGAHGAFGPNFQFTPVPEPHHYAVIAGVCLAVFAGVRRRIGKGAN